MKNEDENYVTVDDLQFETNYINDNNTYDTTTTEYTMMCHTLNEKHIQQAKEFEGNNELFVNEFYFGIIKNHITKRFQPSTCRLFYLNIDGNLISIDNNLKSKKYNEIIKTIKEYVRMCC